MGKKKFSFLRSRLKQLGQTKAFLSALFKDTSKLAVDSKKEYNSWISQAREKIKNPANANFELGKKFYNEALLSDSLMRFKLALLMNNNLNEANFWLGKTYLAQGNYEEAGKSFEKFAEKSEKTNILNYFSALTKKDSKIPLPTEEIIIEYFSLFGDFFDETFCRSFNYQGISEIFNRINLRYTNPNQDLQILEIGSGTGMLATKIKEHYKKAHISGVDFCPKMIDRCKNIQISYDPLEDSDIINLANDTKAKQSYVYDRLIKKNFFDYTKNEDGNFDIIASRGFLHYCNDLKTFFKESAQLLKKRGCLIFYVTKKYKKEEKEKIFKERSYPFYLEIKNHTKTSIEKAAKEAGFTMDCAESFEIEQDVKADLYIFEKK